MSTPDAQHKIRVVAEKFEVKGWKPGRPCPGMELPTDWFSRCICGGPEEDDQGKLPQHEEPPPDLLSPDGAWALEDALVARKIWVNYFDHKLVLCIGHYSNAVTVPIDGKRSLALLTAAFQITEEGRK